VETVADKHIPPTIVSTLRAEDNDVAIDSENVEAPPLRGQMVSAVSGPFSVVVLADDSRREAHSQ